MLVYDEQLPVLDDSFEGDEVSLLAVRGRKVDPHFRRNYAWAKHAADRGKLKKIVVVVAVTKDNWVHTVGAVTSALSGAKLHTAARFKVDTEIRDIGTDKLTKVLDALNELKAPEVVTFGVSPRDVIKRPPKPSAPKAAEKDEVKDEAKDGKDGE